MGRWHLLFAWINTHSRGVRILINPSLSYLKVSIGTKMEESFQLI